MPWYHLSKTLIIELYETNCQKQIKNKMKPSGFWLSKNSEWEEWLNENFESSSTWGYNYKYKITLRKNINILKISTFEDLEIFNEKYGIIYKNTGHYFSADWKKVCDEYDGIFFENYEKIREYLWKNDLTDIYTWYLSLDVTSACIFRPSLVISKLIQVPY